MIELHRSITIVNHFADRLRHARTLRKMSQGKLAAACGLSQSAIANYESKIRKTAKNVFRLAEALDVNPVWLGTGNGPMEAMPAPSATSPAYKVSDRGSPPRHGLWPFSSVSSEQYWALRPDERQLIEGMVASMLRSLRNKA